MSDITPFMVSFVKNGTSVEIPCRGIKSAISECRKAHKERATEIECTHEGAISLKVMEIVESFPAHKRGVSSGSIESYVALRALEELCHILAPQARKRPLIEAEMRKLLEAIENADDALEMTDKIDAENAASIGFDPFLVEQEETANA